MKVLLALILLFTGAHAVAADPPREDVEKVFDQNKGKIFAQYSRALRDNPRLKGKIVFDIDIAKTGAVTGCRVRSSTLGAPDLERNLCGVISQMKFASRDSATTVTKPVDFFPAA